MESPHVMALAGPMTLRTIAATHRRMIDALDAASVVELDLDEVDEADLSFVQLIEAARAAAVRTGKSLRLKTPAAGPLLATLQRGGFVTADSPDERVAFWMSHQEIP